MKAKPKGQMDRSAPPPKTQPTNLLAINQSTRRWAFTLLCAASSPAGATAPPGSHALAAGRPIAQAARTRGAADQGNLRDPLPWLVLQRPLRLHIQIRLATLSGATSV